MSAVTGGQASSSGIGGARLGAPALPADRSVGALVTSATTALTVLTALGAAAIFWVIHTALVDDAYITLSYARTLAFHGQWGMMPGYQANTATSPLNVLLLGGATLVVRDAVVAAGVVYVGASVATALGLLGLGRELGVGYRLALFGTPLLVANPLLVSTVGLETTLVAAAMVHLAWAAARRDAVRFGLVAGLLLWLRLDTVAIVAVLALATPGLWRRLHLVAGLAVSVVLPWLLFSWIFLGSAIPDTLVIKQANTFSDYAGGLYERYAGAYPAAVASVTVVAVLGLLTAGSWLWWRRRIPVPSAVVPALALAGIGYYFELWLLDVAPFFWYYGPPLAALTTVAAIGMAVLSQRIGFAPRALGAVAAGVAAVTLAVPWAHDMAHSTPLQAMPVHGNWALPGEYKKIATALGRRLHGRHVRSPGEVGALLYYCDCVMSDRFSDRARILGYIEQREQDSWLFRLNYNFLDTSDITPIGTRYAVRWRPGHDRSGKGWNAHGFPGGTRPHGHFVLVRWPPGKGR